MDQNQRVSEYWASEKRSATYISWLEHPAALREVCQRLSGNVAKGSVAFFKENYFPAPVDLALSLGCGFGLYERACIESGIAKRFHANDISEGAIEKCRELALKAGLDRAIEYSVKNLDTDALPEKTYDAIFGISSVHHVFQLEGLFKKCRAALKPGGLLFLDEYIGPSRFQSSPEITSIINEIRDIFPEQYKRNLFVKDGSLIGQYTPSPVEHFERTDPSEAIRSGEIVSTLKLYFDVLEIRPYGGAILHMLFSGIMGNFDDSDPKDVAIIRLLAMFEEKLERAGAIPSDFAVIVARPRTP